MYTKHDLCICQGNILQKETRRAQYCTFNMKSIQGFKVKQTRAEANTNILQKAKHILVAKRYKPRRKQTSQVCNFLPERTSSTSVKSSSFPPVCQYPRFKAGTTDNVASFVCDMSLFARESF